MKKSRSDVAARSVERLQTARQSPGGLAWFASKGEWRPYPYLMELNRLLVEAATGRIRRLLVNLPPRHGKSTLVSRYFPAWYTGIFPDKRILLASYEGNFAASWGRKAKDVVDAHGRTLFRTTVRKDSSAASDWQLNQHEGGMSTSGVGGPITGKGAGVLIIDDPLKNDQEARSRPRRDLVWDWYKTTAYTRLDPGGAIVVIQTRWHEDDLAGRLLKEMASGGEKWHVLSLPAIARENDPLGRKPGEALCPERYDVPALEEVRRAIGAYWYGAMYDQSPVVEGGNIFQSTWFGKFRGTPPGELIRRVQVWDTAHKTGKENDYSTCTTMDLTDAGIFVRHVWRDKVPYPELKKKAVDLHRMWESHELCVEDKDAGAMLIQELQRDTTLPVIPLKTEKDKVTRAHAVTPMCEAGRVSYDEEGAWVDEWLAELMSFPNAEHDDQVDGLVHGIARLKGLCGFDWDVADIMVDTGFRSIGLDWEMPR